MTGNTMREFSKYPRCGVIGIFWGGFLRGVGVGLGIYQFVHFNTLHINLSNIILFFNHAMFLLFSSFMHSTASLCPLCVLCRTCIGLPAIVSPNSNDGLMVNLNQFPSNVVPTT